MAAADLHLEPAAVTGPPRQPVVPEVTSRLLGADGLTAHATHFDRRAVVQALATAATDGALPHELRRRANRLLDRPDMIALGGEPPVTGRRYSTLELLAVETRLVERATARISDRVGTAPANVLAAVLADRPSLGDDQAAVVGSLVTCGAAVEVVVGKAGTGKTYTLDAARALSSVVCSSYNDDVTTTAVRWASVLNAVNEATRQIQLSLEVPDTVTGLVDGLESELHADAPFHLDVDPYLTAALFAGAYRAAKALRHDDATLRRRDVRIALEQVRQALRDIVENQPVGADVPTRQVLARTAETLNAGQKDLADLLGVSTRQLQRWLAVDGPEPAGRDEARIRIVGQVVNQLRHVFTGPGVLAWFHRAQPVLGGRPVDKLDDPFEYPQLLGAATGARAMAG